MAIVFLDLILLHPAALSGPSDIHGACADAPIKMRHAIGLAGDHCPGRRGSTKNYLR
jgi:hypothetical protein